MNAGKSFAAVFLFLFGLALTSEAQINIQDRIERKIKERADRKVDRTIDKGLDEVEEGMDKGAKDATKGKGGKEKRVGEGEQAGSEGVSDDSGAGTEEGSTASRSLKAYSKFDFVPGEEVVGLEDFSQDEIGDFPAKWNTNSGGEVVTLEGQPGRWLKIGGEGFYYPEFLGSIPENATVEFDVATSEEYSYYCGFIDAIFVDAGESSNLLRPGDVNRVLVSVHPQAAGGSTGSTRIEVHGPDGAEVMSNDRGQSQLVHRGIAPVAHVAIWRQRNRLRMYLNEEKVWDVPRAFQNGADYRLVLKGGSCKESIAYLGNLRVAAGAPDTRNKLVTEGRLVTRGILFDSGSDRVRPESHGTLKEIAAALSENPSVRVRIIGHTDNDGEDAANMELSKRRAAAVKEALSKEFGIDPGRMESDGKGESQPASPNDSAQGKANNRRVEFVKL